MVGSSFSIAGPNVVINTIIAEALKQFADKLEKSKDFSGDLQKLLQETAKKHKRIIFNGNNYSDAWVKEAEKRGLKNIPNTPEALKELVTKESEELFVTHKVFTKKELHSRYDIMVEQYNKTLNIEARTMIDMAKHKIIPAAASFAAEVAQSLSAVAAVSDKIDVSAQKELLENVSTLLSSMNKNVKALEKTLDATVKISDVVEQAAAFRKNVFAADARIESGRRCTGKDRFRGSVAPADLCGNAVHPLKPCNKQMGTQKGALKQGLLFYCYSSAS